MTAGPVSINRSGQRTDTPAVASEAIVHASEALATAKPAESGSKPCNCCRNIGT